METPSGPHQEPRREQTVSECKRCNSRLVPYGYVRLADGTLLLEAAAEAVIRHALHLRQGHPTQASSACDGVRRLTRRGALLPSLPLDSAV